jgi:hypothetical protein
MKILWFWRYNRYYNKDERLHTDFARIISQDKNIELKMYGPYLEDIAKDLIVMPFNLNIVMDDILKKFKPDVIILNTKCRMFWSYTANVEESSSWLPFGWHTVDVPKIMIEEDYHYINDDNWYKNHNINMILQRHYAQSLRKGLVKTRWFPFSVDTNIFKPNYNIKRKNKCCFVGSMLSDIYNIRQVVCNKLNKLGIIDIYSKEEKLGNDYIKCLQEYAVCVNGSPERASSLAKMFEIMASGSVLFTNENKDLPLLFDEGSYISYNLNNIEDTVKIALEYANNISNKGIECIKNKHSHQIRIEQLKGIINEF